MNKDVRKLTDAAMMVAILGVMIFLNRQTAGMIEVLFCWALPIPMVFYAAKYGLKDGLLPLFGMIVLVLMFGTIQSFYYFIVYGVVGLIYGSGVKANWKSKKLLFFALVVSTISTIITTVLFASFFGYDISSETQEIAKLFTESLTGMGLALPANFSQLVLLASAISLLASALLEGLLIHLLSSVLLRRLGFKLEKSKSILEYNVPIWSGYVALFIVIGGEYAIRQPLQVSLLTAVTLAYLVASIYLLVFGYLGIVSYAAVKFKKNVSFYLIIAIFFLFTVALPILIFSGFLFITTQWRQNLLGRAQNGQTK